MEPLENIMEPLENIMEPLSNLLHSLSNIGRAFLWNLVGLCVALSVFIRSLSLLRFRRLSPGRGKQCCDVTHCSGHRQKHYGRLTVVTSQYCLLGVYLETYIHQDFMRPRAPIESFQWHCSRGDQGALAQPSSLLLMSLVFVGDKDWCFWGCK